MRNKSSSVHRWNNMDYDILVKIFMSLNVMDLIAVVSQVCSSWRSACCDPILWKKLDLCIQISDSCIYAPLQSDAWSYSVSNSNRLMNILKTTSNLSQGNVTCLIFNFFEYVEDEHLVYAAKRNRNLKRLALPIWSRLTVSGMRKAFKYWKGLESLTVPDFKSPMQLMKAIGTTCKNFSELKLTCNLNLDYANAIVKYVPKLKVLSLRATIVFNKETLICILDGLKHLEVLNICHCEFVFRDSTFSTTLCQELDKTILEKGSRLREFLACQTSCTICQSLKHYEFEKVRREDEVISLALYDLKNGDQSRQGL